VRKEHVCVLIFKTGKLKRGEDAYQLEGSKGKDALYRGKLELEIGGQGESCEVTGAQGPLIPHHLHRRLDSRLVNFIHLTAHSPPTVAAAGPLKAV
jgi:hypothetical protein